MPGFPIRQDFRGTNEKSHNPISNKPVQLYLAPLAGTEGAPVPPAAVDRAAAPARAHGCLRAHRAGNDARRTPEPQSLRPIKLGVGFIPSVQFAPLYVGIEQGFFAEEGIELSLEYGFENDYLKLVATDELQFMIASGDQMVLGRAQELPVKYVMNWYTSYPVTVFAKADAGIHEPADLAGRTVGVPGPFAPPTSRCGLCWMWRG